MLYRRLFRPLVFRCQPETAHHLTLWGLRRALGHAPGRAWLRLCYGYSHESLRMTCWGQEFANPIGLAAGMDKNAEAIPGFAAMGLSHVEIGTVTGQAQPGNDQPRLFRLVPDQAIINRMGFNNDGCEAVAARLKRRYDPAGGQRRPKAILGINLGKTKVVELEQAADDYRASVAALGALADYLVVNVSSPNTPGLRDLQAEAALRPLLASVRQAVNEHAPQAPLLLKIAPDLASAGIDAAVDVARETGIDGIIATNTTITRGGLQTPAERISAIGAGGLSGAPLQQLSLGVLRQVARRVDGRMPVIGVGGIDSPEAAWQRICHGASLIQIYTALVYHGPALISRINRGLVQRLQQHGLTHLSQAVGRDL